MAIKVDSSIMLDTFGILRNNVSCILFIVLKLNSYKDEYGIPVVNINLKDLNKKTNITPAKIKTAIKRLIAKKIIIKKSKEIYYIPTEIDYCNKLRTIRREKFYTRGAVFRINKKFFYKFIKAIDNNYLVFKIYYFLLLVTQHDIWFNTEQVRSKVKLTAIVKLARVWCNETIFYEILNILTDLGLIVIDQKYKIHTIKNFVV